MKRPALIVAALACFTLAAGLILLAADVSRWRGALAAGDVRYRMAPEESDLWRPSEAVPFGVARSVLGVDDDLAFRQALRALRLGGLDRPVDFSPEVALQRADARARLERIAVGKDDPARRSRAMGLVGVLTFTSVLTEVQDRLPLLQDALKSYQGAIALDPANGEAKLNLEVALQRRRGIQAAAGSGGPNPRPGGAGSRGAGAGQRGSGY